MGPAALLRRRAACGTRTTRGLRSSPSPLKIARCCCSCDTYRVPRYDKARSLREAGVRTRSRPLPVAKTFPLAYQAGVRGRPWMRKRRGKKQAERDTPGSDKNSLAQESGIVRQGCPCPGRS
ncbi:hypothetical protein MRX96_000646 [Rhipicephalus microplus]